MTRACKPFCSYMQAATPINSSTRIRHDFVGLLNFVSVRKEGSCFSHAKGVSDVCSSMCVFIRNKRPLDSIIKILPNLLVKEHCFPFLNTRCPLFFSIYLSVNFFVAHFNHRKPIGIINPALTGLVSMQKRSSFGYGNICL